MTEDEFVQLIKDGYQEREVPFMNWQEGFIRHIWRGETFCVYGGRYNGKHFLSREVEYRGNTLKQHYIDDFPEKED